MKRRGFCYALALLSVLLFSGRLDAGEKAKEIKLTTEQAFVLLDVLSSKMEYYERSNTEVTPPVAKRIYYQLDVAPRLAIAKNIPPLEYVTKAASKARNDLVMQLSEGKGVLEPKTPASAKLDIEWSAMLAREHAFKLFTLSQADLQLKENPFPPALLAVLLPILD